MQCGHWRQAAYAMSWECFFLRYSLKVSRDFSNVSFLCFHFFYNSFSHLVSSRTKFPLSQTLDTPARATHRLTTGHPGCLSVLSECLSCEFDIVMNGLPKHTASCNPHVQSCTEGKRLATWYTVASSIADMAGCFSIPIVSEILTHPFIYVVILKPFGWLQGATSWVQQLNMDLS